jgi:hypothetical protein
MTFFKRINTILNTKINPFINNNILRYYHHHSLHDDYLKIIPKTNILRTNVVINLLGDFESVNKASWEINSFAQEKSLHTSNIVYNSEMLRTILYKNNFLQFIVNRCYDMSCNEIVLLTETIINRNWQPYNLYVMPDATNRFTKCDFVENCNCANIIIYPLAAPEENKRRDINILIG